MLLSRKHSYHPSLAGFLTIPGGIHLPISLHATDGMTETVVNVCGDDSSFF